MPTPLEPLQPLMSTPLEPMRLRRRFVVQPILRRRFVVQLMPTPPGAAAL